MPVILFRFTRLRRLTRTLIAASIPLLAAACASDDVIAAPPASAGEFTVNATSSWVYVSLRDSSLVVPQPSASESGAWDIAFSATNVTLNGGAAGPGGVAGACLCQNLSASNHAVVGMTPANQEAAFDTVSAVPAGLAFTADAMTPAISGWYAGVGSAAVADSGKTFLVRLSDSLSFAKVRVRSLQNPTATSAGRVTLEYAVQSSATAAFGPVRTLEIDLTTPGARNVDLNTGTLTTAANEWDLRFDGFTVRVNGGVSGPAKAAAAAATAGFAATTSAAVQANAFRTDVYAGVFGTNRFYRYNIGNDNRISPTFDVYFVKRGAVVYKLQIVNYYNAVGQARHITFRYEQIAG